MLTQRRISAEQRGHLEVNTLADGLFHASTYVMVATGLVIIWRAARRAHERWRTRTLIATILMGFGIFNLAEGIVDHQILGTTTSK